AEVLTKLAVEQRERPDVLERHKRQILELVAPEIAEERLRKELERAERSAHDRRDFTLIPNGEGEYRIRGILDAEMAAILRAALDPLSAPRRPAPIATADQTLSGDNSDFPDGSGGQPDLGAAFGGSGTRPGGSGDHPVFGGVATAAGGAIAAGGSDAAGGARSAGGGTVPGLATAAEADLAGDAHPSHGGSGRTGRVLPGDPDLRSAGARRADALIELCERILHAGELPDNGGQKPHLTVTLPWEQLKAKVGAGLLDTGDLLTPETVRRLACDAVIIPAVLGGDGQVLDVGRARRLIDGPLRRALVLRDRGCAFPGCDRPPQWCDGHHVQAWADGGTTCLANSVLLCGFHHREIHHGHWQVRIRTDGFPEFLPPAFIDPFRRPVQNTLHRRC
ncbi:MAG: DUF222 domain-containing protein, partial [Hamadaea sp.]|nr:DUF222 domain-containing protein [Hamadaea sp.]